MYYWSVMLRCLALVSLYFLFVCFIYLFIHADKETNKCVDFFVDFFFLTFLLLSRNTIMLLPILFQCFLEMCCLRPILSRNTKPYAKFELNHRAYSLSPLSTGGSQTFGWYFRSVFIFEDKCLCHPWSYEEGVCTQD